jgi:hypothetical protein
MTFGKALLGWAVAVVLFIFWLASEQSGNAGLGAVFFILMIVAFLFGLYEWKKGD